MLMKLRPSVLVLPLLELGPAPASDPDPVAESLPLEGRDPLW